MTKSPATVIALCLSAGLLAGTAVAQNAQSRADQLVRYRQSMYNVLGANFGPMANVVQGKAPYDARDFAMRAERVAFIAAMLPEGFVAGSESGKPTAARPEIWRDRAEFDRLLKDMQSKVGVLSDTAKGAKSVADVKTAFVAAGQACKNCHQKFKRD